MGIVSDGYGTVTGSGAPQAGSRPPLAPEPTPQTLDEQVAAMTVDDVLGAIEAGEIDAEDAVAAERRGRRRAGILTLADTPDA